MADIIWVSRLHLISIVMDSTITQIRRLTQYAEGIVFFARIWSIREAWAGQSTIISTFNCTGDRK